MFDCKSGAIFCVVEITDSSVGIREAVKSSLPQPAAIDGGLNRFTRIPSDLISQCEQWGKHQVLLLQKELIGFASYVRHRKRRLTIPKQSSAIIHIPVASGKCKVLHIGAKPIQ